jgi:hypothetical protein
VGQETSWHLEEVSVSVLEQTSASYKWPFSSIFLSPNIGAHVVFSHNPNGVQNFVIVHISSILLSPFSS